MIHSMRQSTLATVGLGAVLEIFQRGRLPGDAGELVDRVFGEPGQRRALGVSGATGNVGAGPGLGGGEVEGGSVRGGERPKEHGTTRGESC